MALFNERGLQAERTALAWRRTGLALAVASLAMGRGALAWGAAAALLVVLVGCTVATVTALRGHHRQERGRVIHPEEETFPDRLNGIAPAAACALTVALCGLEALLLLGPRGW